MALKFIYVCVSIYIIHWYNSTVYTMFTCYTCYYMCLYVCKNKTIHNEEF